MNTEDLVDQLQMHKTLRTAPREELLWIVAHSTLRTVQPGEVLSRKGEVIDALYIILKGHLSHHVDRGTGRRKVMEWRGGEVTGMLPFSRTWGAPGDTIAEEHSEILMLPRKQVSEMIHACYECTTLLVHVMTDRTRLWTKADLNDERVLSMSKLAAGLAHELNNPSSAAVRGAKSLPEVLKAIDETSRVLGAMHLSDEQLSELNAVKDICLAAIGRTSYTAIEFSEREDTLAGWLADHHATGEAAEALAKTTVTVESLERLANSLKGATLDAALRWIAAGCAARALSAEIEKSTSRIHSLVSAVKGFTQMDRAQTLTDVDIRKGISDTMVLLEGKAKRKSARLTLEADPGLPKVLGYAAECNQIWEKLIDNALDAISISGCVSVRAELQGLFVKVSVSDDGPGIPDAIKGKIFDPFFTTKPVGQGTGLGLDIARRLVQLHDGELDVESRPGNTTFCVTLPVAGPTVYVPQTVSR